MAQPTYLVKYMAAMQVVKDQAYTSASIIAAYPTANVLIMKSVGAKVSISGTDMFDVSYDDVSYIESGQSYIFNMDCVIAIGSYKAVA